MSGGHFEYSNDRAARDIFGWDCGANYGLGDERYLRSVRGARKVNPLENKILSELVFDVFCVLHSFDWYKSGDTGEEQYKADVKYFTEKWLKTPLNLIQEREIDSAVEELRKELYRTILGKGEDYEDNG